MELNLNEEEGDHITKNPESIMSWMKSFKSKLNFISDCEIERNISNRQHFVTSFFVDFVYGAFTLFGLSNVYNWILIARNKFLSSKSSIAPVNPEVTSTDRMVFPNNQLIDDRDPVLVLQPWKESHDRNGYNYDVLIAHLSDCDIYYARNLKSVMHHMSFLESQEKYKNHTVLNIPRNADHCDINFGIFRMKNNNYISCLAEHAIYGDSNDSNEPNIQLDWSAFIKHFKKDAKKDNKRDGGSTLYTRHNYGISNQSQTQDKKGTWNITQTAEEPHFSSAPSAYKWFHKVSQIFFLNYIYLTIIIC